MRSAATIQCPVCKSIGMKIFNEIQECRHNLIAFDIYNGKMRSRGYDPSPTFNPIGVEAECKCGHQWRLKGIQQITEIRP